MPSINLDNLERYDSKARNEAEEEYMPKDSGNWQKTEKAGAVSFYPVENSLLEGTVDFLFSETGPASGDKGPENPSTISGVSSVKVTRCGKNLCPLIGESSSSYISVSFTDDGEFVFNGSYIGLADVYVFNKPNNKNLFPNYLERGKTYTFSLQGDNSSVKFYVYRYYTTNYGGAVFSIAPGESRTYTIPDTQSMILRFSIPANTVLNNAKFKLQIEEGSSATEFEPYAGTDYTIDLGSTFYGGTLDVASGVMTVTFAGIVLDGSENWSLVGSGTYYRYKMTMTSPAPVGSALAPVYTREKCTHFDIQNNVSYDSQHAIVSGNGITIFTTQTSLESFKQWLAAQKAAGTPVCLVWPLATPYTAQLDSVSISALAQTDKCIPRLNTVYTDADTIQIGYMKSPQRTEQELTQAILEIESDDSD